MERYTRVYTLPDNLYLDGAPILIAAGALLKDNATNGVLVQLKLRNLYHSPLIACKVHVRAFEPSGAELEGVDSHAYLDIRIVRGVNFGMQEAIPLPDHTTRRVLVSVVQVVFEDGTVWEHPAAEWSQIPSKRQKIGERFISLEMQKQYAIEVGGSCEYLPESVGSLFFCTCGTVNLASEKVCSNCSREFAALVAALDESVLTPKMQERLAEEEAERVRRRIEREQRQEAERKKKEQEKAEEEARIAARKRRRKKGALITSTVVVVVAVCIVLLTQVILPAVRYGNAEKLISAGDYDGAAVAFAALGNYKDAAERSLALWDQAAQRETVSAGDSYTVGLKVDGTVVAVGRNGNGQCDVSDWKDIVAVSGGRAHTVGLKADGTVVSVGWNGDGQYNVSDWTDIVSVSAGVFYTVGLKADGTVVSVGWNEYGQCNVSDWRDIVAVSAGLGHTVGLKADGTVVAVGSNGAGQCDVSRWRDIVAVSAGSAHTVGLKADGTVVAAGWNILGECKVSGWTDIVSVSAGMLHTVGLKADGTVVAVGDNEYGQCDVSGWRDIVAVSASGYHTVGLKADGTVMAVGYYWNGQCDVSNWTDIKIPN